MRVVNELNKFDASVEGISGHMDEGIATQLPYLQVSTITVSPSLVWHVWETHKENCCIIEVSSSR